MAGERPVHEVDRHPLAVLSDTVGSVVLLYLGAGYLLGRSTLEARNEAMLAAVAALGRPTTTIESVSRPGPNTCQEWSSVRPNTDY
ncbi:membrane protein/domain protein [Natrinema pallidum DSM 3751]|uniref:Membrane protein/domain protein n=1 Tax=Natrinema pallidum DSM 3751 TaxID=1227495 RepID=L9YJY1_9EURY|nr:membrane protein/domain protein [Natrinema pallidum DSM 3751]